MSGEVIRRISYEIGLCLSEPNALDQPDGEQPVMLEVGTDLESGQAWISLRGLGEYQLTAAQADILAGALMEIEEDLARGVKA